MKNNLTGTPFFRSAGQAANDIYTATRLLPCSNTVGKAAIQILIVFENWRLYQLGILGFFTDYPFLARAAQSQGTLFLAANSWKFLRTMGLWEVILELEKQENPRSFGNILVFPNPDNT